MVGEERYELARPAGLGEARLTEIFVGDERYCGRRAAIWIRGNWRRDYGLMRKPDPAMSSW